MTQEQEQLLRDVKYHLRDAFRLDWWFDCNEKERGAVMALVHMQGMSKRDAIDKVMSATKGAK